MTTTAKIYSSKSNAIRALKTLHPEVCEGKTNADLAEFIAKVTEDDKVLGFRIGLPEGIKVIKRHIYKGVQFRRRSEEPEGITSAVHDMFDEYQAEAEERNQTLTRKQYIARAVRDGVAYYTARTQYQRWSKG